MTINSIVLDQGETETVPLAVVAGPDDRLTAGSEQRGLASNIAGEEGRNVLTLTM